MRRRLPALTAGLLIGLAPLASGAEAPADHAAPRVDGALRLRGLYSVDSAGGPEVGLSFLDADVRAQDLTSGGLSAWLDATLTVDFTDARERRFGEVPRVETVRDLALMQPLANERVRVAVGRQLLHQAGNAWVDGARVEADLGPQSAERGAQTGVYAGASPDPYDATFRADKQAVGAFGGLHRGALEAALAWNAVLGDGALDRHFVFGRTHWRAADGLFFATYLVADFVDTPTLTTALVTADYAPIDDVKLTLNLSRYAIEQYRDASVYRNVVEPNQALLIGDEVLDLVYERARLTVTFRLPDDLREYQSLEWKHRSQDGRTAWLSTIGVRQSDAFVVGLDVDLQAQFHNGFESDTWLAAVTADYDVTGEVAVNGRATWFNGRTVGRETDRGRLFDESQSVWLVGGGADWRPSRAHRVGVEYDAVLETELVDARNDEALWIHTLMGRYTYSY